MCGFAALIGACDGDVDLAAEALARRGPDAVAAHVEDTLMAVSSRLTHWEEGAATQPYRGPDGTVAVLNGELWNLSSLQEHLGVPGASEIEALVKGLGTEGPDFLKRVDGQFAVVVRLGADGPVYLARDRFGVAPLYYAAVTDHVAVGAVSVAGGFDRVAVGSDMAALMAMLPGETAAYSVEGLGSIFADWAPTGSLSAFQGIAQVPPGHAVRIDGHKVTKIVRWAGDPAGAGAARHHEVTDLARLEELLRESVRVRLRSTTPVACLLSGGIDSTVIGAMAVDEGARTGVGLYLDGDELVRSRQQEVADTLGMDLIHHRLTPHETVETFAEYIATRRVPLVRLGPIGMTALARRARSEGVRAVLSGEGADELFCGYDSYRLIAARDGRFGPVASLPWAQFGAPEFGAERGERWWSAYWRGLVSMGGDAGRRRADILAPVAEFLRPELRGALEESRSPQSGPVTLDDRRAVDLAHLLGSYLLTVQGDHAWMEESIELRPPYLALPVAEWALSHEPSALVTLSQGKLPIRQLLQRLAVDRPRLAGLGFAKAAFRVDVAFVLRDPVASGRLRELVVECPDSLVDVAAVTTRLDACRVRGTCSEAESMLFTLVASFGVLAQTLGVTHLVEDFPVAG